MTARTFFTKYFTDNLMKNLCIFIKQNCYLIFICFSLFSISTCWLLNILLFGTQQINVRPQTRLQTPRDRFDRACLVVISYSLTLTLSLAQSLCLHFAPQHFCFWCVDCEPVTYKLFAFKWLPIDIGFQFFGLIFLNKNLCCLLCTVL